MFTHKPPVTYITEDVIPPTSYDPWSTTIGYGSPNSSTEGGDHQHRVIDPWGTLPEDAPQWQREKFRPGMLRVQTLKEHMSRQKITFAYNACMAVTDEEYINEKILRQDLSTEEMTALCARSWKTETKACFLASLVLLVGCGLLAWTTEPHIFSYSKYFQVPKGTTFWRVIADSRIAGRLCVTPPPVNFPHFRTILTEIAMLGATCAVVADFSFWFYQIPVTARLQRLFGFSCDGRFAVMRCLPMGWSHSPRIAQCIAWGIVLHREEHAPCLGVYESWGADPPEFVRLRDCEGGRTIGLIFLWLDNIMVVCKDAKLRNAWFERLQDNAGRFPNDLNEDAARQQSMSRSGFNAKFKNIERTDRPCFLGIFFKTTKRGVTWQHESERITKWAEPLKQPILTPRDANRHVGIAIWHSLISLTPLYLVKESIDVMKKISPHIHHKKDWDRNMSELGIEFSANDERILRHFVKKALSNPWHTYGVVASDHRMFAVTDACQVDQAEPQSDHGGVFKRPLQYENGAGWVLFGDSAEDFQCDAHRWSDVERTLHINILEMKAVKIFISRLPSQPSPTLLTLGVDNTIVVSALSKQYSSSTILCDLVKEIVALCSDKKLHLQLLWIPGAENAADPVSRGLSADEELNQKSWKILHGAPPQTPRIGLRFVPESTSGNPYAEDFEMSLKRINLD